MALNLEIPDRVPWVEEMDKGICEKLVGRPLPDYPTIFPPEIFKVLALDCHCFYVRAPRFAEEKMIEGVTTVGKGLITGWDDLGIVKLPDPYDDRIYQPIHDFLQLSRGDKASMLIIKLGIADTYLSLGLDRFSCKLYEDPAFVKHMLELYSDWYAQVVERVNELDIDFVSINEDLAYKTNLFFSPRIFNDYFKPCFKKVLQRLKKPWIYHSDGNILSIIDDIIALGAKGIRNIEPGAMDINELKKKYGQKVCLIGNIDLNYTLTRGTPEEVEHEVKARIENIGRQGGYILASANSITNYCRKENVLAMSRALENYGYY